MSMVTRTLIGTEATVKVVNTATDEISTVNVKLTAAYDDPKDTKLVKAIKKVISEDLVIIKVESLQPANKLYGLDVNKFMEMAVELDPTTRKPIQ